MNGIHYTPLGTKVVATQLKRSLYAKEPIQNAPQRLQHPRGGQPLLRPPYLAQQNQQSSGQYQRLQSNSTPGANQDGAGSLIDAMSALLQKWKNPLK